MCMIETVAYPSWWAGATTVQINNDTVPRADVEFLPQGASFPFPSITGGFQLVPWPNVTRIIRIS